MSLDKTVSEVQFVEPCRHCGERHVHGFDPNEMVTPGLRSPHCTKAGAKPYRIKVRPVAKLLPVAVIEAFKAAVMASPSLTNAAEIVDAFTSSDERLSVLLTGGDFTVDDSAKVVKADVVGPVARAAVARYMLVMPPGPEKDILRMIASRHGKTAIRAAERAAKRKFTLAIVPAESVKDASPLTKERVARLHLAAVTPDRDLLIPRKEKSSRR